MYYFEYGTIGAYGSTTTSSSAGSGTSAVGVLANLVGLSAGATYDFRLVAANAYGTTYGGNLTFTASSATTTTLVDSPTLALPGDRVTLTAAVSPASAIGTIEFTNGSSSVLGCATVTLVAGAATCVTSFTVAGTYRLSATYSGSTGFGASSSAMEVLAVNKSATRTTLRLSVTKVLYGHEQVEHLSVTVSPEYPATTPTGTVTITGANCRVTLSSGQGSCSLSATKFHAGNRQLVATYNGNAKFKRSASVKKTLAVVK
jgi:hypothetical protein